MLIYYGKKRARINKFNDSQQPCKSCKSFDFIVKVYERYFHIFFLPIIPIGAKTAEIRCNNCGEPLRIESIEEYYINKSRAPIYLYSGLILFAVLIAWLVYDIKQTEKQNKTFVENPKVGDVYSIKKIERDTAMFFFFKINKIKGDTIFLYQNNFEYNQEVTSMNSEDFFIKDMEMGLEKKVLEKMLEKDEIISVKRLYDSTSGFYRVK